MPADRQNPARWLLALLGAALLLPATAARAQDEPTPEETALARSLFQQGMAAVEAGDYETAADRLGRALEIRDSAVVRTNYALALIELGHFVEASEHLEVVVRTSEEGSDARRIAEERLAEVRARFGRLQIDVTGALEGVEVQLDGDPVPAAGLGVPQPADPGEHIVSLSRGARELTLEEVTVTEGQLATVALVAPPPTPEEVAAAEAQAQAASPVPLAPRRDEGGGVEEEPWLWILVGVLVAGAIAGAVTAVVLTTQDPAQYEMGSSGNVFTTLVERP